MKQPSFFQVGQPKSGTSALHAFLDQHPNICMSTRKEPLYFCTDFRDEADRTSRAFRYKFSIRGESDYRACFKPDERASLWGESTTHYLYSTTAAARIQAFNPDAKILILLREPVSFLYSYHAQCVVQSLEDETDFERALELEDRRKHGECVPRNAFCPSFLHYSERTRYARHIERFLDAFGERQVKVLIHEDFRRDNLAVFRSVLEFLEVDPDYMPRTETVNPNQVPRNPALNRLLFQPHFRAALHAVLPPNVLASHCVRRLVKRVAWEPKQRPRLDNDLCQRLMRRFEPEVHAVSRLLGRDLVRRWGYDKLRSAPRLRTQPRPDSTAPIP